MNWPSEITLVGRHVRLEGLSLNHFGDLLPYLADPDLQQQLSFFGGDLTSPEKLRDWTERQIEQSQTESLRAFAVVLNQTQKAIGSTSFLDIAPAHLRAEIGSTWLGSPFWRTAVNSECKYLLLRYAFEELGLNRVQLKTDVRNVRSQKAIERLGASKEGVLRQHMVLAQSGHVRDTVMYSVIRSEWPSVKKRLEEWLDQN